MSSFEQNEELLKAAALALGPLLEKVAFVGGATTILHITDKLRDVRATTDVDVIIEASRADFHKAEAFVATKLEAFQGRGEGERSHARGTPASMLDASSLTCGSLRLRPTRFDPSSRHLIPK